MKRLLVPFFFFLATTTLPGLSTEPHYVLESCGDGGGSLIDNVLCDPDHLVQPVEYQVIIEVLSRCGENTGHKLLVFLAATLPHDGDVKPTIMPVTTNTTDTKQSSDSGNERDGEGWGGITHLKELVVAANNLSTTSFPVILLIGVKDRLQMTTWWSDSLSGVLTSATMQEAQKNASTFMDPQLFIEATVHVACYLCQKAKNGGNSWSVQHIILTITWIAFTVSFVVLLLAIAVILIRGRIEAQKTRAEKSKVEAGKRASRVTLSRASDTHNWCQVSFKSTGHVFLGTTDVTAVPPRDCTSTDNLLENC